MELNMAKRQSGVCKLCTAREEPFLISCRRMTLALRHNSLHLNLKRIHKPSLATGLYLPISELSLHAAKGHCGGVVSAHAMHAASGRSGRRAEIDIFGGSPVSV